MPDAESLCVWNGHRKKITEFALGENGNKNIIVPKVALSFVFSTITFLCIFIDVNSFKSPSDQKHRFHIHGRTTF